MSWLRLKSKHIPPSTKGWPLLVSMHSQVVWYPVSPAVYLQEREGELGHQKDMGNKLHTMNVVCIHNIDSQACTWRNACRLYIHACNHEEICMYSLFSSGEYIVLQLWMPTMWAAGTDYKWKWRCCESFLLAHLKFICSHHFSLQTCTHCRPLKATNHRHTWNQKIRKIRTKLDHLIFLLQIEVFFFAVALLVVDRAVANRACSFLFCGLDGCSCGKQWMPASEKFQKFSISNIINYYIV